MTDAARIRQLRTELRLRLEAYGVADPRAALMIDQIGVITSWPPGDPLGEPAERAGDHPALLRSEARDAHILGCLDGAIRQISRR